jgi:hypothetical protein
LAFLAFFLVTGGIWALMMYLLRLQDRRETARAKLAGPPAT